MFDSEDLDLNPSTVEQVKFEYSPLRKIFNNKRRKQKGRTFEKTKKN